MDNKDVKQDGGGNVYDDFEIKSIGDDWWIIARTSNVVATDGSSGFLEIIWPWH